MRTNPVLDTWQFLGELAAPGEGISKYAVLALFLALLITALGIAWINRRQDPAQKTRTHLVTCICRVLVGCMWFQASLSELPLPISDHLRHATEQMAQYAAFDLHRQLVTQFYVPHLDTIGPLVFLAELAFAISFILGFAVPLFAALATLFSLHLWLGLYLDPNVWPWTFVFLGIVHAQLLTAPAGRSLGLDAFLHRHDITGFKRAFG
jgi:uncharacterized membrane protein YphA (DoxX/SURF4 family)